jgi:hypothetical protein
VAAQLVTNAGGAQSRSVTIEGGQSASPSTVAAGGISFDPLTGGGTTVAATIPGFDTTDAGVVNVTVTGGDDELMTLNTGSWFPGSRFSIQVRAEPATAHP